MAKQQAETLNNDLDNKQESADQQEQATDVRHGVQTNPILAFVEKATKKPEQIKVVQISASLPEKWHKMFERYFTGRTSKTQVIENALTAFFAKNGFTVGDDGELQHVLPFPEDHDQPSPEN